MNLTGDTVALRTHQWNHVDYSRESMSRCTIYNAPSRINRPTALLAIVSVRPKIVKVAKAQLKNALKSYMLRPVVRSVEMDEPLEHLTEMRQVVILFINVITVDVDKTELITLVNAAYKSVCE